MPAPATGARAAVAVRYGVPVTVRVPATTANLGPGFDSLGMALDLHDEVTVEAVAPEGSPGPSVDVEVSGAGAGTVPLGEDHLVVRSVRAGLARAGAGRPSLRMRCRNVIPHGRGLGSSASAVVAGLVAARGLLADPAALDDAAVFDLATAAEGHPDNASAAVFGGFTVSWTDDGPTGAVPAAHTVSLPVDPRVRIVVCVPDGDLATSRARAMLPATVPHGDAAFNAGRAALLVEAVTRRPELLLAATADRLHQEQRASAMPASAALLHALRAAGVAAVVSGAGPSVLVLGTGSGPVDAVRQVLGRGGAGERWQVLEPDVALQGAYIVT